MSRRSRRIAIGVAAVVLLQVAAFALYLRVEGDRGDKEQFRIEVLRGDILAPNILLERSDGTRVSLHAIGGNLRLVHFWATWCPPCVDELPGLRATSDELAGKGLTLIAVSMDENWDVIRSFFAGEVPPNIYRAVHSEAHKKFDVATLPDTYLVPSNGRLRVRYGGARNWRSQGAKQHLRAALR